MEQLQTAGPTKGEDVGTGAERCSSWTRRAKKPYSTLFLAGRTGGEPAANLVQDASGTLYGTASVGGDLSCSSEGCGLVFKLDKAGEETVLYTFTGGTDGASPGVLLRDRTGTLYGATADSVFKLSTNGTFSVLYSFNGGTDGYYVEGLVRAGAGILYGTTALGGDLSCWNGTGCGSIFKLIQDGKGRWKKTILYAFTGGTDGASPNNLVRDSANNLYGVASQGGNSGCGGPGCGTVFELDKNGKFFVLHTFSGGTDGAGPEGLIVDHSGGLYGTTTGGGKTSCRTNGCGTVFKLVP
jgi:uncharacterized repeat protein (TIGR03803 family)